MKTKPHILVVDDDQSAIDLVEHYLTVDSDIGRVSGVQKAEDALAAIALGNVDIVLLDLALVGMSGIELLKQLRQRKLAHSPAVVAFTSCTSRDVIGEAVAAGADDYFYKGHLSVPGLLPITISAAWAKANLMREAAQRKLGAEVFAEPADFGAQLQRCAKRAQRLNATCRVLLIGVGSSGRREHATHELSSMVLDGLLTICRSHDVLVRIDDQRIALIAEFGDDSYRHSILLAKRILIALDERLITHSPEPETVQLAVGIATVDKLDDGANEVLARAERALEKARGSDMRFAAEIAEQSVLG